jgi:WD40 repeat protein
MMKPVRLLWTIIVFTWASLTLAYSVSPRFILALAWSPDGTKIALGDQYGVLEIWDSETQARLYQIQAHQYDVMALAWDFKSGRLASVSADGALRIWNGLNGSLIVETIITPINGYKPALLDVSWNFDDQLLAVAHENDKVWIIDPTDGSKLHSLDLEFPSDLEWAPNQPLLSIIDLNGQLILYHSESQRIEIIDIAQTERFDLLSWNPNGAQIALSDVNGRLYIVESITGLILDTYDHQADIDGLSWSPDGIYLAATGIDSPLKIWNLQTGQVEEMIHSADLVALAWSPYGVRLAVGGQIPTQVPRLALQGDSGIGILTFEPSLERLNALLEECTLEPFTSLTDDTLNDFRQTLTQASVISTACLLELNALTNALLE